MLSHCLDAFVFIKSSKNGALSVILIYKKFNYEKDLPYLYYELKEICKYEIIQLFHLSNKSKYEVFEIIKNDINNHLYNLLLEKERVFPSIKDNFLNYIKEKKLEDLYDSLIETKPNYKKRIIKYLLKFI